MDGEFHASTTVRIAVGIPVHNEEDTIGPCLQALARQQPGLSFEVVALLNNCSDSTADIVRRMQPKMPYRLLLVEYWLARPFLNAGTARRLAMEHAAELVDPDGILLSTDADGQVSQHWLERNLRCFDAGADAVAGKTILDPQDAAHLPPRLLTDDAAEMAYTALLDEIDWRIDPLEHDPWPRHVEHSGASIAVRAGWLARIGGVPDIPLGEDRALFARLAREDARVRHARDVTVTVSGRSVGRAVGGMADTIANRIVATDRWIDDALEPAADRVRRTRLRRRMRAAWAGERDVNGQRLATMLRLPQRQVALALSRPRFGMAWEEVEAASPVLQRQRVPTAALAEQTKEAMRFLSELRVEISVPAHQADIVPSDVHSGGAEMATPAG